MSALRKVHRTSAIVLALYALVHLANHLAAVRSVAAHIAFMSNHRCCNKKRPHKAGVRHGRCVLIYRSR